MMTQQELTMLNIGQSLDDLCNIDPRGYGVCHILYAAARDYTGYPLTMNAAKQLAVAVNENDLVYILTGFLLRPFNKAETDGVVGSVLLARSLVLAFGAKPVLVCPEECLDAMKVIADIAGLPLFLSVEELQNTSGSVAVIPFTKDIGKARMQADELLLKGLPAAVIAIECPGANPKGVYHNAVGLDVTELEAKSDILFQMLKEQSVLSIAIGDLGNETGMGTLYKQLVNFVPYAAPGQCACPCGGGIAAKTAADHILTATVSDWGCYGLTAALAYLKRDIRIMHDAKLEKAALSATVNNGLIDMTGRPVPAIDGFNLAVNTSVVTLMRECVDNALKLEIICKPWFDKVMESGFYGKVD